MVRAWRSRAPHSPLGDLLAGRLARLPFGPALAVPYAYSIVCPRAAADLPKITAFRDWLVGEAEEDARRLEAVGLLT